MTLLTIITVTKHGHVFYNYWFSLTNHTLTKVIYSIEFSQAVKEEEVFERKLLKPLQRQKLAKNEKSKKIYWLKNK